jgi:hypothetical protein
VREEENSAIQHLTPEQTGFDASLSSPSFI